MAATLHLNPGIDQKVAAMIAPAVQRIADKVVEEASGAAPKVKVWNTMEDDRVRPWHRTSHGQAVPDNLLFVLDQAPYHGNQHPQGHDYLRFPRDPRGIRLQVLWCRCFLTYNNDLGNSIKASPVQLQGSRAVCLVSTDFPRAREAEYGTSDGQPAAFMRRGLLEARALLHT